MKPDVPELGPHDGRAAEKARVQEQPHRHGQRLPATADQLSEDRVTCSRLIKVHRLRIVLFGKGQDHVSRDGEPAGFGQIPDLEVLQIAGAPGRGCLVIAGISVSLMLPSNLGYSSFNF